MRFTHFSKRSMYDMSEVRSLLQKAFRNPYLFLSQIEDEEGETEERRLVPKRRRALDPKTRDYDGDDQRNQDKGGREEAGASSAGAGRQSDDDDDNDDDGPFDRFCGMDEKIKRQREFECFRRFHYFLDEYLDTMRRDPSILALFLAEDCATRHPRVLEEAGTLLMAGEKAERECYHGVANRVARMPVDRSAAYLSVACIPDLEPDVLHPPCALPSTSTAGPETTVVVTGGNDGFLHCMERAATRIDEAVAAYPMRPTIARQLAEFVSSLVRSSCGWCDDARGRTETRECLTFEKKRCACIANNRPERERDDG